MANLMPIEKPAKSHELTAFSYQPNDQFSSVGEIERLLVL